MQSDYAKFRQIVVLLCIHQYVRVCTSIHENVQVFISIIRGCKYSWSAHIILSLLAPKYKVLCWGYLSVHLQTIESNLKAWQNWYRKTKYICLDTLSTWPYIRKCTELPEFFIFTLFFSFLTPPNDVLSCEVPGHMFKHDEKVINCAQLGCHSLRLYSYIPQYTIMRFLLIITWGP